MTLVGLGNLGNGCAPLKRYHDAVSADTKLLGRDRELAQLQEWVEDLASGTGRALLIEGEPGIGKSALARAAAAAAEQRGCQVFMAAADELGQALPLQPLLDALRSQRSAGEPRLTTVLRLLQGELIGSVPDAIVAASEQMLTLMAELCSEAATVLIIDDVQWADPATIGVCEWLARSASRAPLLLIGIMRPVPQRDELLVLHRSVGRNGVLHLSRLPDEVVADLITMIAGGKPCDDLLRLADGAAGNPLYLTELMDALTIYFAGEESTFGLLILSQVILSMQLPFAIVPLIHFTSDRSRMGQFANRAWVKVLAWTTAAVIIGLNVRLAVMAIGDWLDAAGRWRTLVWIVTVPVAAGIGLLLLLVTFEPWITRRRLGRESVVLPETAGAGAAEAPVYQRILVPLDHTDLDRLAVSHAAAMAKLYGAKVFLLHVEEGVTSQVYGEESSTAEVTAGARYLEEIAESLRKQGVNVDTAISHSPSPTKEIVRYAREVQPDLVIMGAHGHGGLKDLIFGNTINPVRHNLRVPMLIVRPGKT